MSYAIQNMEGKHLGFLLFAGDENSGECIFRSLPSETAKFGSPDSELLLTLQSSGEFSYKVNAGVTHISHPSYSPVISINNNFLSVNDVKFKVVQLEKS